MQSENRLFDDFVKMVNGMAGPFAGMGRTDFVGRDEFEAVKAMAAAARDENEALTARIAALEAKSAPSAAGAAKRPAKPKPGAAS